MTGLLQPSFGSLPVGETGRGARVIGRDEAGNLIYEGLLGQQYVVKPEASPADIARRQAFNQQMQGLLSNPLYSSEQARIDVSRQNQPTLGGLLGGLWEGIKQGVTAPGRAASGEPVTNADAWATALDYGGIAAPLGKPAGALGAGGIRAYHGSPHDFDKFSLDKIGTGEGAQAYGHGLYFAENEGVAQSYRDMLKRDAPGNMYEVNINADPADFLDWDRPLSEQSPKVQSLLPDLEGRGRDAIDRLYTLESAPIHEAFRRGEIPMDEYQRSNPNVQVSQRLREAGIPGIKYLDAGSRGAGDGSRNFVVFDDNLISIVRKYGIAGAAAMLGITAAELQAQLGGASASDINSYFSGGLLQ